MIELDSLSISFEEKTIIKNLSLEIKNHLSILGANGSGKSTLAKAICDLVSFEGEIKIDSKNIQSLNLKEKAQLISYIPAKLEVYDEYISVYEFVLLGRFPYKKSFYEYSTKDKYITLKTLKFLNIEHLTNHSLRSLSSGEQQLTLIAQALTQQSKIIILDEPTANLDPYNSKIIAQHIKGLKEYHQIILITHDLHLASYVDSPALFIKEGDASYYKDGLSDDTILKELYGVAFNSLAVRYG